MARPELCVLLAYAKRSLKTALLESSLVDDPYLDRELRGYFPPKVVERFGAPRSAGTRCAASWWRRSSPTTSSTRRASPSSRGSAPRPAQSRPRSCARTTIARQVTGAVARWAAGSRRSTARSTRSLQNQLMVGVDRMVEDVARWYLLHPQPGGLDDLIAPHAAAFAELASVIDTAGPDEWRDYRTGRRRRAGRAGRRPRPRPPPRVAARADAQPRHRAGRADHGPLDPGGRGGVLPRRRTASHRRARAARTGAGERLALGAMGGAGDGGRPDGGAARGRRARARRRLRTARRRRPSSSYLATRSETYERLNRLLGGLEGDTEVGLAALTVALRQVRGVAA